MVSPWLPVFGGFSTSGKTLWPKSSFLLEKHLEDYIIKNWSKIELNKDYDIHKENNKLCTQYSTGSGPLDILAISKDKKEFLVIELKKGRASDVVMGQIQRYMGHIKNNLAGDRDVKGLIIALEDDKNLVILRRKRNRAVTFMYFVFFLGFVIFMSFMNQILLRILNI